MVPSQEAFYHRIKGNYELISSGIDREDLLHVVTAPPEVYLGEGGMGSIVNNTRVQNRQETKMEVFNNLLNRIAFTEEVNLTYQDRVYITDVLNKLGIQDVKQFMSQVSKRKQETRTTEQLISLYWNHLEELTNLAEEYRRQEFKQGSVTEVDQGDTRLSLHEEILNRLQTGAIYQILDNFYTSHNGADRYVTRQELQVTEQKRVAVNVLLNRMKQVVNKGKVPFVYRHENYYESSSLEENPITKETVSAQITSAVLLNLVDSLYLNRFTRLAPDYHTWLHMEDALYQTAENTLWRLKYEITNLSGTQDRRAYTHISQQKVYEQELDSILQLLALAGEEEAKGGLTGRPVPERDEGGWPDYEKAQLAYPDSHLEEEGEEEARQEEGKQAGAGRQREVMHQVEHYLETVKEEVLAPGKKGEEAERFLPGEKLFAEREMPVVKEVRLDAGGQEAAGREPGRPVSMEFYVDGRDSGEETIIQETKEDHAHTVNLEEGRFWQQLSQYMQFLRPVIQNQSFSPAETYFRQEAGDVLEPKKEAGKEGQVQAENQAVPGKVLERWQGRGQKGEPVPEPGGGFIRESRTIYQGERENRILTEHYEDRLERLETEAGYRKDTYVEQRDGGGEKTLPKQNLQQVFVNPEENLELLKQQIDQINRQNVENYNQYRQAMKTLEKEVEPSPQHPAERIRRESLKALANPERLLEEYRQETKRLERRREEKLREIVRLLPEQTRRLYEQLRDYEERPEFYRASGQVSENNLGLLLHDIQQVEQENRKETRISTEETRQLLDVSDSVLERWNERAAPGPEVRRKTERNDITMVHKSVENQLNEEVLEQLMEQNRLLNGKAKVTSQVQEERQETNTTVYQQSRQTLVKESQDITELVQRGIQRQVGAISEQVYKKLERRLQNEKKRRGY